MSFVEYKHEITFCFILVGLNVTSGIPKWTFGESKDLLLSEVFWENGQPDKNKGTCVYAKKNGYFSFGNCLSKLPFICKSHAVLKGKANAENNCIVQIKRIIGFSIPTF